MKTPSRKLAEWITLILSALVVFSVVIYLVWDLSTPNSSIIEIEAKALVSEAQKKGNYFVLPIEVHNRGQKTISMVKLEVQLSGSKKAQSEEMEIQYLGRDSKQRVYMYLSEEPKSQEIQVRPIYYYFD